MFRWQPMSRRKLYLTLGVAVVVAALLLLGSGAFRPASVSALKAGGGRITRQNFDRIRLGMSWSEVVAILGPPGNYVTGDTDIVLELRDSMTFDGDPNLG